MIVKDYGNITMFDMLNTVIFKELYHAINLMTASFGPSPSWHNYNTDAMVPQNNQGDAFAENNSAGTFAASLGDAQAAFSFNNPVDGVAPYSIGSCYYDGGYGVGLEGLFAYARVSGYSRIFPATIDIYCFSPKMDDFCFESLAINPLTPTPPNCDNGDPMYPAVLITGEEDWTGGTVAGLNYGRWTRIGGGTNAANSVYSRSVGDQAPQTVIDPIAKLGYIQLTPSLGAGYTVTKQLSIMRWSFQYTGPIQ